MNDPVVAVALVILAVAAVLAAPWWSRRVLLSSRPTSVTIFVNETTDWEVRFLEKKRFTLTPTPARGTLKIEVPAEGVRLTGLPAGSTTSGTTITAPTDGQSTLKISGETVGGPYECTVQAVDSSGHPLTDRKALGVVVIAGLPTQEQPNSNPG